MKEEVVLELASQLDLAVGEVYQIVRSAQPIVAAYDGVTAVLATVAGIVIFGVLFTNDIDFRDTKDEDGEFEKPYWLNYLYFGLFGFLVMMMLMFLFAIFKRPFVRLVLPDYATIQVLLHGGL